jgi:hypothetical protein
MPLELGKQTSDPKELSRLLLKLCEKTGRRLRRAGHEATGMHVACVYTDFSSDPPYKFCD